MRRRGKGRDSPRPPRCPLESTKGPRPAPRLGGPLSGSRGRPTRPSRGRHVPLWQAFRLAGNPRKPTPGRRIWNRLWAGWGAGCNDGASSFQPSPSILAGTVAPGARPAGCHDTHHLEPPTSPHPAPAIQPPSSHPSQPASSPVSRLAEHCPAHGARVVLDEILVESARVRSGLVYLPAAARCTCGVRAARRGPP